MRRLYLPALFLLALAGLAWSQQFIAPPVQQSATRADAATVMCTITSSGAAAPAVNTQTTATCTPPAGQFVYITGISFDVCTNGTGTAVNQVNWTSTNLTGTPVDSFSIAATASICQHWSEPFALPLKSTVAGTAVTFVSPAAAANNSYVARVYAYYAP
jgi:hypothetical protein